MTVLDDRDTATDAGTGFPLWQLLEDRPGCFDVLAAPGRLDGLVAGVTLWDPVCPPTAGDLVIVTAPRPDLAALDEILAVTSRAGVAAVVIRGGGEPAGLATLRGLARRRGAVVLTVSARLSWDEICTVARSLVPAARFGLSGGGPRAGSGLFELAESAALVLGGAVAVTDAGMRVLAFANLGRPVDALWTESIMTRRASDVERDRFAAAGLSARSGGTRAVVRVDLPGAARRLVAPVVARDAVAGFVVLAEGDRPFTRADERTLADAATAAAGWFVGVTPDGPVEDALQADLLRGVLDGHGSLEVLARELGRPDQPSWCLIGLAVHGGAGRMSAYDETVLARTARMLCPGSTATVIEGTVAVLSPSHSGRHAVELADRLRSRYRTVAGADVVACVSEPFSDDVPTDLHRLLGHGLAVLAARDAPGTATLAEVRPHAVLAELAKLAGTHTSLLDGPLDALRRDPTPRTAEYLTSLAAWFDNGCDLTRAARNLQVHRNTLRYRLQRIEQLCAVDLENPVERFALELQVRLLTLRRSA